MRKLAWIKSGSFVRAPLGEILNDVDVIDLHAKIEMKGTSDENKERGRRREERALRKHRQLRNAQKEGR